MLWNLCFIRATLAQFWHRNSFMEFVHYLCNLCTVWHRNSCCGVCALSLIFRAALAQFWHRNSLMEFVHYLRDLCTVWHRNSCCGICALSVLFRATFAQIWHRNSFIEFLCLIFATLGRLWCINHVIEFVLYPCNFGTVLAQKFIYEICALFVRPLHSFWHRNSCCGICTLSVQLWHSCGTVSVPDSSLWKEPPR